MGFRDWLKSDAERLGRSVPQLSTIAPARDAAIIGNGEESTARINERLPHQRDRPHL